MQSPDGGTKTPALPSGIRGYLPSPLSVSYADIPAGSFTLPEAFTLIAGAFLYDVSSCQFEVLPNKTPFSSFGPKRAANVCEIHPTQPTQPLKSHPHPLLLTLLLAGLAALSPAVHAAVVNITLNDTKGDGGTTGDTLLGPYTGQRYIADWLGTGTPDLIIAEPGDNQAIGLRGLFPAEGFISAGTSIASPIKYLPGQSVGASSAWNLTTSNWAFRVAGTPNTDSPDFGAQNYLGFRFTRDSDGTFNPPVGFAPAYYTRPTPEVYYYGYFEVTWASSTGTMTILSAAYESTADTAITIPGGSNSSVPDSSSTGALGLLLGGVLVRHWRRQRRAA
jgi:hypothetical protein